MIVETTGKGKIFAGIIFIILTIVVLLAFEVGFIQVFKLVAVTFFYHKKEIAAISCYSSGNISGPFYRNGVSEVILIVYIC